MLSQNTVNKIGWFASFSAILMFSSYIDQIRLNLQGQTGSLILPLATLINCIAWLAYAILKENKDWPLIVCNTLGILVSTVTAITALI